MALDKKIATLDRKTKRQVKETLKSINIALKLNSAYLKSRKVPKKLMRLMEWKKALEQWQNQYGKSKDLMEMAEGLGAYHEICVSLG